MRVYTIGFAQKDARSFFTLLRDSKVRLVADIRLNNSSQLAGYAKGKDLEYFLKELVGADYIHDLGLAPTKALLEGYRKGEVTWEQYEIEFLKILKGRNLENRLSQSYLTNVDGVCFLCSESTADNCHRRLVVEFIQSLMGGKDWEIVHL